MRRKTVLGIMLSLLLIGMLTLAFNIQLAKAEPTIWTVDDDGPADFSSIQEAINSSLVADGDTIFVHSGTYYERVVVNKSVSLIGEDEITTTAIITDGTYYTVHVSANNVTISGFEIQNSGYENWGIILNHSSNSIVKGNIVVAEYAILVDGGSENNILDNKVWGVFCVDLGLKLMNSSNNVVTGNYLSMDCHTAFRMDNSNHNYIAFNYIAAHFTAGLLIIKKSANNLIVGNTIEPYMGGYIGFVGSNGNVLYHNNFVKRESTSILIDDNSTNNTWG